MDLMELRRNLMVMGGGHIMVGEFSKYQHLDVVPTKFSNLYCLQFEHSLGVTPKLIVVKGTGVAQLKMQNLVGHIDVGACVGKAENANNVMQNCPFNIDTVFNGTYQSLKAWFLPDRIIVSAYSNYQWDENVTYSVDVYA